MVLASGALGLSHLASGRQAAAAAGDAGRFPPLDIDRDEWKKLLAPERYRILFRAGTERPGSSPLDKQYDAGTYVCAACSLPLFDSKNKFDSGTGWPSFTQPIEGNI